MNEVSINTNQTFNREDNNQTNHNVNTLFAPSEPPANNVTTPAPAPTPTIGDLVGDAFNSAAVATIKNDEALQDKILGTAKDCVEKEIDKIKTETSTRTTAAKFDSAADACSCYCFSKKEKTTPIWAVWYMKGGYNLVLFIYLIFATFTVLPITFLFKKIQVGIKMTWLAILLAVVIYLCFTFGPILVTLLRTL